MPAVGNYQLLNLFPHMIKYLSLFITTTSLFLLPTITHAQTYSASDRIPSADNSQIGTQVKDLGSKNFSIEGGLQRGQNLLHSFTDFSVPTGGSANFTNPAGNQSIITRVTGNFFSDINGLLNTNGANFLLINPNGVVFGKGVKLNVGKAFVTSTASGVDFVDAAGRNYNFGVNRSGDEPLLSIDPNVAFNPARLIIGGSGSKGIENYGILQTNNPGQYVGLIGGNVNFYGGQLIAPGAKVELGGVVQNGTIGFSLENGVQIPVNVERGNVSLVLSGTLPSAINVESGGGGSVGIFAKDIRLQGIGTRIRAGIAAGLGSPTAEAGDIRIDATGNISLSDRATILNRVNLESEGKGGSIEMISSNLSVTNGAQLNASTRGKGNAGKIKITATENVSFDGSKDGSTSGSVSRVDTGAEGTGGGIEIVTRNLFVINSAGLSASTLGKGDAGSIKITATDNIFFDESSSIRTTVQSGAIGKGGGIEINTNNLSITNTAELTASTFAKGDAGNIKITATGNVSFDGNKDGYSSAAFSTVEPGAEGKGGGIDITAGNLSVTNGAQLQASTFGKGDAGKIKITSTGNIALDGRKDGFASGIFSAVDTGAEGKGGGIEIVAGSLSVTNRAVLESSTLGIGDAGQIKITATGNVLFGTGAALSTVEAEATGNGGGIEIVTPTLSVTNGGVLAVGSRGKGDAGKIKITAADKVSFDGSKNGVGSAVLSTVQPEATGKGGGIEIVTPNLSVTNGAALLASNLGRGEAGDIFLKSNTINLNEGKILSTSNSSTGGNINLFTTDFLLMRNDSLIATDSQSTVQDGNGGNITISSPLIIALPGNNDITANAYQGNGGQIKIDSQGLFGIQYRPTGSLFTNDITASSTFGQSGSVQIDTPGIDPGNDKIELVAAPNDASKQISQACGASQRDNKFYITGRGGLPPNAREPQESDALWEDARAVKAKPVTTASLAPKYAPPAIGWVFEKNGRVRLIAAQTAAEATGTKVVCPTEGN
jgi:filamentous hemagglutinin family protein